ncbi:MULTISPECIES: gamma-glutamyl-gamma-aminobutyrate hydrolase family protein [unclassified Janthinobacterium]|jgi:putative glutamine amidotransferase|uniref:gamma-glutamyl-gamma-aminobutyrate hydrolase family protein n=1 Tax=unclassified Janthinobacterium TaxID=2610881 RepID=UPI0018C971AF|nr:gamma-glutamyl-gamma-aminobutyrate hydrolase family protein [Janthinobacterium sp. CG_23.4]MDH6159778.1 putative glutamine amidotransferase [Janthinobacterium sp. CG_23.4]
MRRPIVLVPACQRPLGNHVWHMAQEKYLHAVLRGAGCMPLLLPALGVEADLEAALQIADGVMLTGSASNVDARLYGEQILHPDLPQDPARDATTLPLIRAALARQLPLLAICRGFQEVNVALGGSLHQAVHALPGMLEHRENVLDPLARQYACAHRIKLMPEGLLSRLLGGASEMMVNSLHGQGIARLAEGLLVEAWADDGLVEAYTLASAAGFTLAVQWHPEWQVEDHPQSMRLFGAFGQACRDYQQQQPRNNHRTA